MDINGIISRVKRIFGDESGVQVIDDDILQWISDAQREIVMHNEHVLQLTTTVNIVDGTDTYAFPTDLLVLRTVRIKMASMETYAHIEAISPGEFDRYISGRVVVGEGIPCVYTTYERKIFLYPTPDQNATDGLQILYTQRPTDVTAITDTISLPEEYHNAIVKYCLMKANQMDEDYEISAIHGAEFAGDVKALSLFNAYNPSEVYPRITVLPEDA
jgi:hypothetical protein